MINKYLRWNNNEWATSDNVGNYSLRKTRNENYQSSEMNVIIATRCCVERKISYRIEWNCEDPRASHDANTRFMYTHDIEHLCNQQQTFYDSLRSLDLCWVNYEENTYTKFVACCENESRKILTWMKSLFISGKALEAQPAVAARTSEISFSFPTIITQ